MNAFKPADAFERALVEASIPDRLRGVLLHIWRHDVPVGLRSMQREYWRSSGRPTVRVLWDLTANGRRAFGACHDVDLYFDAALVLWGSDQALFAICAHEVSHFLGFDEEEAANLYASHLGYPWDDRLAVPPPAPPHNPKSR